MAFSPPAKAQETDPRFYIGAGGGMLQSNGPCAATYNCDDDTSAFKMLAGSRFSDNFALEVAYSIIAEVTHKSATETQKVDGHTFSVAPVLHFPISNESSFLAKVGVHNWETDYDITNAMGTALLSFDGTDIFYGVGAQFDLSENLGVRIEWERYETELSFGNATQSGNYDFFGASLIYNF